MVKIRIPNPFYYFRRLRSIVSLKVERANAKANANENNNVDKPLKVTIPNPGYYMKGATKPTYVVGLLAVLIILGAVYVTLGSTVRIRVDNDKTTFYVKNQNNRWVVSGREYLSIFDGTSKINRRLSGITIETFIDQENETVKIIKTTPYIRGPIIRETYFFDGTTVDVEMFPVYHNVEVINGSGFFLRYDVRDLVYGGITYKLSDETELEFGRNMKVKLNEDYRWAWVYKSGVVKAQYDIDSDHEFYSFRLFDPIASYTADDFFTKLISNTEGLSWGESVFEFTNPTVVTIPIQYLDTFKINIYNEPGATQIKSLKYYQMGLIPYTVSDYKDVLVKKTCWEVSNITHTNSSYDCSYNKSQKVGEHTEYEEGWIPLDFKESLGPKETMKIKIRAEWNIRLGSNKREWIPSIEIYKGYNDYAKINITRMISQKKWAWWDTDYVCRRLINSNSTTVNIINITLGGLPYFTQNSTAGENTYVYYKEAGCGVTLDIAIGNETDEQCWLNETDGTGNCPNDVSDATMLAWLQFNNDTGIDVSGTGNDLTKQGSPVVSDGVFGRGSQLLSTDNHWCNSDADGSFMEGLAEMTIVGWVYFNSSPAYWNFVHKDSVIAMRPKTTTHIVNTIIYADSTAEINSADKVEIDGWYQFAVTHKSGSQKVYINGTLQGTGSANGNIAATNNVFSVGLTGAETCGGGRTGDMSVDELRFYDEEKSQAEIQDLYYQYVSINGESNHTNLGPAEGLNVPPTWSLNATKIASPAIYNSSSNYGFEVTWTDGDAGDEISNVTFETNFTTGNTLINITKNNASTYTTTFSNVSGVWYINFTQAKFTDVGDYVFRWYANDTQNAWNKTDQWGYTINHEFIVHVPLTYDEDGNLATEFDFNDTVIIRTNITHTGGSDSIEEFKIQLTDPSSVVNVTNDTALKFSDTFTESNNGASNWNAKSADWEIYSNQYRVAGSSTYNIRTFVKETELVNQTDLTAQVRVMIDFSGEDTQRIIFRYEDADNYAAFFITKYYSAVGIEEYIAGTRYFVDTSKVINFDQWYTMKVSVSGNIATGYLDGERVIQKTLTISNAGVTGLGAHLGWIYFDNFTVGVATKTIITDGYTFEYNFTVPDNAGSEGEWIINVYGEDDTGALPIGNTTTFDVVYTRPFIRNIGFYEYGNGAAVHETEFTQEYDVTIRANITDPQGEEDIYDVLVSLENPSGTFKLINATMDNVTGITNGYVFEYNFTIPKLQANAGSWTAHIFANDTDNNLTTGSNTFDVQYNWTERIIFVNYTQFYNSDLLSNITQGKSLVIYDIDGDGTDEIILIGRTHNSTGTNKGMIRIYNVTEGDRPGWDFTLNLEEEDYWNITDHTFAYSVNVTDIDGDGENEIIIAGVSYNGTVNFGHIAIFNYTDNIIKMEANHEWIYGINDTGAYGMIVNDLDEDGTDEIITIGKANITNVQIVVWNYTDGVIQEENSSIWTLGATSFSEGYALSVADLDDDGTLELISGGIIHDGTRYNAFIRIFNYTTGEFEVENSTYWYDTGTTELFSLTVSDIDGDSKLELLTSGNWHDGSRDIAHIRVWNYSSETLQLQANESWYESGHASAFTILSEDLDGGINEIVTVGFQNDGRFDRGQVKVFGYNTTDNTLVEKRHYVWTAEKSVKEGDFTDAAAFIDFDDDGNKELVTTGKYSVTPPTASFVRIYTFATRFAYVDYLIGNLSVSVIRFQNVSTDWEYYPSSPQGQSTTQGIINATNIGLETGDFYINYTGTLNTGWTLYACNDTSADPDSDPSNCFTLSTSLQKLYTGVTADTTQMVWLYANASFVSANPGVSIYMSVV